MDDSGNLETTIVECDPFQEKLKNEISNYKSNKCPACSDFCYTSEKCFEHLIDHFENSQRFLYQRCDLITWLRTFIDKLKHEPIEQVEDDNKQLAVFDENLSFSDVEIGEFMCKFCENKFSTSNQLIIHSFSHAKLIVPNVNPQLKCPLCGKYFCSKESCYKHVFTHISPTFVHNRPHIIAWLAIFISSAEGIMVLQKYDDYTSKLSTPLLSKILVSEVESVKSCKFCKKSVSSVFDLLENHSKCQVPSISNCVYCVLCNFKAIDMNGLSCHFFSKHIACYCGYHGEDFNTYMAHSADCQVYKNGILCPMCRINKFASVAAFKEHIEDPVRRSCGLTLKASNWICFLCKKQSSQNDMFRHVFTEHISCQCGVKCKDFRSFCFHTSKCSLKASTIVCPVCNKAKCHSEISFIEHILNCVPWEISVKKEYVNSVKICDIQHIFKPEEMEILMSMWGKKSEEDKIVIKKMKTI